MNWGQGEIHFHPLLASIVSLQQAGKYLQATQQLADQDAYFYDQFDLRIIYILFASFPPRLFAETATQPTEFTMNLTSGLTTETTADVAATLPADWTDGWTTVSPTVVMANLHYLQALLLRRTGQMPQAGWHLAQAKVAYTANNQIRGIACATLELARLARQQEEWQMAQHYLYNELQPLFDQQGILDDALQAHCALQMADVARNSGDWRASVAYAEQALTLYKEQDHPYGQLLAQVWLATYALSVGNYPTVSNHLQQARQQLTAAKLGALAEAHLLYGELLLACHQREMSEAFVLAQRYLAVADMEPYTPERIEARLLLGNLYRDRGEYQVAQSWYRETSQLIEQLGYVSYLPRLQAELAWLYLLDGELAQARAVVDEHYQLTPPLQRMALQVVLAILEIMDGEWEAADVLLQEALAFYEKAGDALAVCALRLYLAYSAFHQPKTHEALQQLAQGLGWLVNQGLTAFPCWWHPKILAEVCTQAMLSNLYPDLINHILVHHLGKASLPFLKLLDTSEDLELRRHALRLQQVITGRADPLAHLPHSNSKQIIQELMARGDLRAEAYRELESELMTASNRLTPNPTIVAVFGLYLKGLTRAEIAQELDCSTENVRNYITIIYNHFALPAYRFHGRQVRRKKLIEVAQARGFTY